jgi:hypothetical protein
MIKTAVLPCRALVLAVLVLACDTTEPCACTPGLTTATLVGTVFDADSAPVPDIDVEVAVARPAAGECPSTEAYESVFVQRPQSDSLGGFGGQLAVSRAPATLCLRVSLTPAAGTPIVIDTLRAAFRRSLDGDSVPLVVRLPGG